MMPAMSSQPVSSTLDDDTLFDVRPIPCRVKHGQIFQRWFDLPVGGHFVLLNDHDPVPLHYQFAAEFPEAFAWEYLERGPEDFRVKITKLKPVSAEARQLAVQARAPAAAPADGQEIDVRGLEPPEPLIRILDRLESLPAGATLRARTDREPCHLFGEAEQRGFRCQSSESPEGGWLTVITRA